MLKGLVETKFLAMAFGLLLLAGCDSGVVWEDGKYKAMWLDTRDNVSLSFEHGESGYANRIGPRVVGVGSNATHIVVRQVSEQDQSESNFYVIDKRLDNASSGGEGGVTGPLTKEEYDQHVKKHKLPPLHDL